MCAIAGVVMLEAVGPEGTAGGPDRPPWQDELRAAVRRMNQAQAHRGPDDDTVWGEGPVVFGHRRLSIIDLDGGRQPLSNEDGRVQVICNGEIYNYRELGDELRARGHHLRTRSDIEVLAHAYEEWGALMLGRLQGMFALALYDARRRVLLLARDAVGEKPLYYHDSGHAGEARVAGGRARLLSFASEAKGILALPWVRARADAAGLADFLRYRYIPSPRTAFEGVRKLPAGAYLQIPLDGGGGQAQAPLPEPTPFWDLSYRPKLGGRRQALLARVEDAVSEAVRSRLVADVPLGVLVSGGIDSTLVLGLMRRHLGGQPLSSFCAGFADPRLDERPEAEAVARALGTDHHACAVSEDAVALLPRLLYYLDEPLGDPSIMPTFHVAGLAARHVKAVLTGDGGDEAFAGYDRYRRSRLSDLLRALPARPHGLLRRAVSVLGERLPWLLPPGRQGRLLQRLADSQRAAEEPLGRLFEQAVTAFSAQEVRALLHAGERDRASDALEAERVASLFDRADAGHYLDRFLYSDLRAYLADDLMVKSDRMTMAHGLEARAPLLDTDLLELAAALPVSLKRRPGSAGKLALRAVAGRVLPAGLAERVTGQRKRGFTPPLLRWLDAQDRALAALLDRPTVVEAGLLDGAAFRQAWDAARTEGPGPAWLRADRRFLLVMLELWHRVVLLGDRDLVLRAA